MIIKLLSRHSPSYGGLIDYLLKEGKGGDDKTPEPLLHNFRGTNKNEWVKELCQNEAFRKNPRKGQIYFQHAILSFNNLDSQNLTPEILKDLTQKFIELRGKDGMYLTAQHNDRDHLHIHCLISGLKFKTGKAFRLPKDKLKDLKVQLQNYQIEKYPELKNSLPNHGSGKEYLTPNEYGAKIKNSKSYKKSELALKINEILNTSSTQENFLEKLREQGYHHYERGGKIYGITLDDKNYRFNTLGVSLDKMNSLPNDLTQEEQALKEISELRQQMETKKEIETEQDIPDGDEPPLPNL